jgi:hypothetical protein
MYKNFKFHYFNVISIWVWREKRRKKVVRNVEFKQASMLSEAYTYVPDVMCTWLTQKLPSTCICLSLDDMCLILTNEWRALTNWFLLIFRDVSLTFQVFTIIIKKKTLKLILYFTLISVFFVYILSWVAQYKFTSLSHGYLFYVHTFIIMCVYIYNNSLHVCFIILLLEL